MSKRFSKLNFVKSFSFVLWLFDPFDCLFTFLEVAKYGIDDKTSRKINLCNENLLEIENDTNRWFMLVRSCTAFVILCKYSS